MKRWVVYRGSISNYTYVYGEYAAKSMVTKLRGAYINAWAMPYA